MRIGMILDKTFPPDPRVENEAVSLIKSGHEVFLFCLKYSDSEKDEIISKIKVKRYKSNKLTYKLSALAYTFPFYSKIMAKKIEDFLTRNQIQAIHIHDIQIAEAVVKANKTKKLPVVLDLHENRPEIMRHYPHLQRFPGKYLISVNRWKQKERLFIKNASNVLVVTQEAKKAITDTVEIAPEKICVVPNTVRKSFYQKTTIKPEITKKLKNNFILLYIGDTGLRRGLLTAIDGIAILKDKIKNIKLVIVGSNASDDVILKNRVAELKISDFVVFEGWQNETTFQSYIAASHICISPLHKNKHHNTTYANKVFQYMSLGKPLLVSDATAQKNIVQKANAGLVHTAEDCLDFSEKVIALYKNPQLAAQLGAHGRAFVTHEFYWEKTSKKLIDLYSNLSK